MRTIIDIGNSKIKIASFEGSEMKELLVVDSIEHLLQRLPNVSPGLYSTVRQLTDEQKEVLHDAGLSPLSVDRPLPIRLDYKTPETLGLDRIAAAAGAYMRFPSVPLFVIDAGTCITMDLVLNGVLVGGVISPGIRMRARAMHEFTHKLPLVNTDELGTELGKSTHECLHSGAKWGAAIEIDERINRLKVQYPDLFCVFTGGDASAFESMIKNSIFAVPNLVLHGLNEIAIYDNC